MRTISIHAMAKINLALDVLRRREDGYHEVRMIMQTIGLYDTLELEKTNEQTITVICDKEEVPCDESNLIYQAARLFMQKNAIREGIRIHLAKRIPIAAGMAGGSTDAASALIGMNELFEKNCSKEELARIAVSIGADVPYCLYGGTYLSEGIGEILTPLPDAPDACVLVAKPNISVSTKYVYENLHVNTIVNHPDVDGMIHALKEGSLPGMIFKMGNILETVTIRRYPIIEQIKNHLLENGAEGALMSGSGPTVFAIFAEEKPAQEALSRLWEKNWIAQGCVTTFVKETGVVVKRS